MHCSIFAVNVRLDVHGVNGVGRRLAIGCGGQMSSTDEGEDNRGIMPVSWPPIERDPAKPIMPPSELRVVR
jgi:hypothetical protein